MNTRSSPRRNLGTLLAALALVASTNAAGDAPMPNLPDPAIAEAYAMAARQSVLPAVNPGIFPGYWSVCADGVGHGHGNTFPALDGHQMADALLWLGEVETVRLNWDYVRGFQRPDGQLPFAILPAAAGQEIGPEGCRTAVDPNGGLYRHWVPDDPLRALGYPTYLQNADAYFRRTGDRAWLEANLESVNAAADFLTSLVTDAGAVGGAGYYVERPTRVEYDGVTQCHAIDAFRRAAALNRVLDGEEAARRFDALAERVEAHFQTQFWTGTQFAEYIHPERGPIATHGLTDVDWCAIAFGVATAEQTAIVWPKLKDEAGFRYGGMPTGIATHPERYASWEFAYDDRMDLAAMGRVWYIECQARAHMGDAEGLFESLHRVCEEGKKTGYYWRERYGKDGGFGVEKYCEYPANLIRIVQRFLFGVELGLDGGLVLAPCAPASFWEAGFGQTLTWRGRSITYTFRDDGLEAVYTSADPLTIRARLGGRGGKLMVDGQEAAYTRDGAWATLELPGAAEDVSFAFGGL